MNQHITTAYYDRDVNTIEGLYTVQTVDRLTGQIIKKFSRLPARSGQRGHTHSSWERGKSPIPFTFNRFFYLWIGHPKGRGLPERDPKEIGRSYPISSDLTQKTRIHHPDNPNVFREFIELHFDQRLRKPGSIGCPVLVQDTDYQRGQALELFDYLDWLAKQGTEYIRQVVL